MIPDKNYKLVDNNYKIVIIGDSGVGKTSFMYRLIKNDYLEITNSTIGAAYFKENINYKDKYIRCKAPQGRKRVS